MSVCISANCRRVRFGGMSLLWHCVHGKIPSENGGGGTSTRWPGAAGGCDAVRAATGTAAGAATCAPPPAVMFTASAIATAQPTSVTTLRMHLTHRALHLAQPHGLKHLQPLPDHRGDVQGDGGTHLRIGGAVRQQVHAPEGQ